MRLLVTCAGTILASEPAGRVPDMGGPQVATFANLLRTYLRVTQRRRPVVPIPVPGTRAIRADGLVVSEPQTAAEPGAGTVTWEEFLTEKNLQTRKNGQG